MGIKVLIQVKDGVAEVMECPEDVDVTIDDLDEQDEPMEWDCPACGRKYAADMAHESRAVYVVTGRCFEGCSGTLKPLPADVVEARAGLIPHDPQDDEPEEPTKLPPDPEGQNDDRAKWAGVALDAFQAETGTDDCDKLGDLLGDLMHWCDRNNQEFEWALDRARNYYREETLPEPQDETGDIITLNPTDVALLANQAGVKL